MFQHLIDSKEWIINFGLEEPWFPLYTFKFNHCTSVYDGLIWYEHGMWTGPRQGFFNRKALKDIFHCGYCATIILLLRVFIKPLYDFYCYINNYDSTQLISNGKYPRRIRTKSQRERN